MKKSILTILSSIALLTSCQDAYEIDQDGLITQESLVYKDAKTVLRGVNTIYATLIPEKEVQFQSVFTDEVGLGKANGGQGINDGSYSFVMDSGNGYAESIWYDNYGTIFRINRMLPVIDRLIVETSNNSEELSLKKSKAELLALRAFCHLKVFAYYTPDYTKPDGLSVMKVDFIPNDNFTTKLPRLTVKEMEEFIAGDIEKAFEVYFNDAQYTTAETQYITKGALDAMLVKLYSMTEKYDEVIKYSERLINSVHGLDNPSEYFAMFRYNDMNSKKEILFSLLRSESNQPSYTVADIWYTNNIGANGTVLFDIGRSLYNELDDLDPNFKNEPAVIGNKGDDYVLRGDLRYIVNVHKDTRPIANYSSVGYDQYITNDQLLIGKYIERPRIKMQNDMIALRFSDVILSLAEARANKGVYNGVKQVGNYDSVEGIIYNLRKARINPDTSLTEPASMPVITNAQSAWKAILNERRVEFAFEGYRYLDVKRIGKKANAGFLRDPQDCFRSQVCSLEADSYKMTMPIPRKEINNNGNMVQNPGY